MPATPRASAAPPTSAPLALLLGATADAVAAVRRGRSLTDELAATPAALRPGTQALSFQALRGLGLAQGLLGRLASRPPPPWVEALLLAALALAVQDDTPYPAHTLVSQAVEAAKRRAPASAGFVNAVLRRFLREREPLIAACAADPVAAWNHPRWWIDRLRRDWPSHWEALLAAANQRAPMMLRVNLRQGGVDDYLRRLSEAGLAARAVALPGTEANAQGIELAQPCPVQTLPGFETGAVSVQDLAAQQAAPLLLDRLEPAGGAARVVAGGAIEDPEAGAGERADRESGERAGARAVGGMEGFTQELPAGTGRLRVLDACAAPGGKTAHLLERADLDLLALDADASRLVLVDQTLRRLGLSARLCAADARDTAAWWDGRPFDAILLDAPCSASGIVRRHPDVRWLRRDSDIAALARTQSALLDALWPLLRPRGRLLYAVCSIFRDEGEAQVDAFLQRTPDACVLPSPGYLLPLADNPRAVQSTDAPVTDGFFYALLERREPPDAGPPHSR